MRWPVIASFFIALSLAAPSYANEIASFGKSEGFRHVIAISAPEGDTEAATLFLRGKELLEALADEGNLPDAAISLVLTTNDYSRLPEDLRPAVPEGAAEVISLLERSSGGAVVLLLPEEAEGQAVVRCGVKGKTAPLELLSVLVSALEDGGIDWRLEESHLDLYRIGWTPENHILKAYFDAGIPAIAISASEEALPAIIEAARSLSLMDSARSLSRGLSEQNYVMIKIPAGLKGLAMRIIPPLFSEKTSDDRRAGGIPLMHLAGGKLILFSERLMVSGAVILSSIFLLYICVLFLSSPSSRKRRARHFFQALPFPFLFAVANYITLRLGEALASALVILRFGKPEAWDLLPRAAIFTKLACSLLLSSIISSERGRFRASRDTVSIGYTAVISALINIFVFSGLEFSMSGYFILCYLLVFAYAHTKLVPAQIGLSVLALAVFAHLYAQILAGNTAAISALYSNKEGWNVFAALFALPFQLMAIGIIEKFPSRLKLSFKLRVSKGKSFNASLPLVPLVALAFLAASMAALLTLPAWSREKPLPVVISESVTSEGLTVSIDSPAVLKEIELKRGQDDAEGDSLFLDPAPEEFIRVDFSSRDFLDRKVYELAIIPSVNARRIDVRIFSESGIAVNISTLPFRLDEGGREALFESSENPETPLLLSFITGTAGSLHAEISCWSEDNPFGFYIEDEDIQASNLLFIKKEIALSDRRRR